MNTSAADLRVLVTAGAAGIGLAIATTFADAGARVFVCDIDRDALGALNTAQSSIGTARADVSNPAEVAAMFDEAISFLGGLDVLVNNAGVAGPTAPVEQGDGRRRERPHQAVAAWRWAGRRARQPAPTIVPAR